MKKIIFIIALMFVSLLMNGCSLNNKKGDNIGLSNSRSERITEEEYYKNFITNYSVLLSDDNYKKFIEDLGQSFDKKMDEIDKFEKELEEKENTKELGDEYVNNLMTEVLNKILKDDVGIQKELITIKEKINSENYDKEYVFSKNNECSKNINDINLKIEKIKKTWGNSGSRYVDLKGIFYSPKLNKCLYILKNTYTYEDVNKTGISIDYEIHNYTNQIILNSYNTVSSDDRIKWEDTLIQDKNFKKFILENSSYDIDLLKNID